MNAERKRLIETSWESITRDHDRIAVAFYERLFEIDVPARAMFAKVDMEAREVTVTIDLKAGDARATVWTNDLTHAYVHENSAYSS